MRQPRHLQAAKRGGSRRFLGGPLPAAASANPDPRQHSGVAMQPCSQPAALLCRPHRWKNSSHQSKGLGVRQSAPQGAAAGAPSRSPSRSATASSCGHSSCARGGGEEGRKGQAHSHPRGAGCCGQSSAVSGCPGSGLACPSSRPPTHPLNQPPRTPTGLLTHRCLTGRQRRLHSVAGLIEAQQRPAARLDVRRQVSNAPLAPLRADKQAGRHAQVGTWRLWTGRLAGWLAGWLAGGRQAGWQAGWQAGRRAGGLSGGRAGRQAGG